MLRLVQALILLGVVIFLFNFGTPGLYALLVFGLAQYTVREIYRYRKRHYRVVSSYWKSVQEARP